MMVQLLFVAVAVGVLLLLVLLLLLFLIALSRVCETLLQTFACAVACRLLDGMHVFWSFLTDHRMIDSVLVKCQRMWLHPETDDESRV
jgi:hypothetical protein